MGSSSASVVSLEPSKQAGAGAISVSCVPRFRPPEAGAAVRICLGAPLSRATSVRNLPPTPDKRACGGFCRFTGAMAYRD